MFSLKRLVKKDNSNENSSGKDPKAKLTFAPKQKGQLAVPSKALAKKAAKKKEEAGVSSLYVFSYRLLGNKIKFMYPRLRAIERRLELAMMPIPYEAYLSAMVLLSLIGGAAGLAVGIVITLMVKIQPAEFATLLPFIAGSAGSQVTFMMMYMYPKLNANTRKRMLGEELPYFMGYMATLASSGLTMEGIFRTIAGEVSKEEIVKDAKYITRNIEIFGMDVLTAVQDLVRRSTSKSYTELLEGLIATIQTGGDLKEYFQATAKVQLEEKKLLLRKITSSLGIVAEMYTVMLIVFPLLAVIMLSIMAIMTPNLGGMNLMMLLSLLTYAFVPVIGIMMLLMMDAMVPKR